MNQSIWNQLKKPIFILAPMEDVTDTVFRQIVTICGRPDLFFTEFTSTAGLCSEGFQSVKRRLDFTIKEKPIIAQIWGNDPKQFYQTAKIVSDMGFDGIDINMGCPDKVIVKRGSCGGLIGNPTLAKEIIAATKEGSHLPVSVKTRIGYKEIETETWISFLLEQNLAAITIHGRTVREMSKVPAHWDEIQKAVLLRNKINKDTLIIGNGDIVTRADALEKYQRYNVDGLMIGRGIFHNLWFFNTDIDPKNIPFDDKLQLLITHIQLFNTTWKEKKSFNIMKKFYKIYVSDHPDASNFRSTLMELKTPEETILYIKSRIGESTDQTLHHFEVK